MSSDEPEGYLLDLDGGPPRKPRPVYDPEIVNALIALTDAGAHLLETPERDSSGAELSKRDALWNDLKLAREIIGTEVARRRRAQKEARG